MISFGELAVCFAITALVVGYAVYKSRLVRTGCWLLLAVTLGRLVLG